MIDSVIHYLTVLVAIGVAAAVFGMFYRGPDGDRIWNAGLLIAVIGVFGQEWVLHTPPWPLPALVTGIIALLLLARLLGAMPVINRSLSGFAKEPEPPPPELPPTHPL